MMKKRLLSILVSVMVLLLSEIPAWAEMAPIPEWMRNEIEKTNTNSDVLFKENQEFFKYLGYVTGSEESDEAVSRGYALDVFVKMHTSVMQKPTEQDFKDVALNSEYADVVHTALVSGLIEKKGDKINLKEKITLDECGDIALNLLGYSKIVGMDKESCINDLKLYKNISKTKKNLTMAEFYVLIKNILMADVAVIKTNNNSWYDVEVLDKSFLEYKKDIKRIDGVITANDFSAIYDKENFIKGHVELNKMEYSTICTVSEELLGKTASIYIDLSTGNDVVVCVMALNEKNNELVIPGDMFEEYDGQKITYIKDNSKKSVKIAEDAVALYNNQYFGGKASIDKIIENTDEIRLVDNNKDNRYDVVFVEKKEYAFVNYASPGLEIIRIQNGESIELSEEKCEEYRIFNDLGEEIEISEILSKNVLEIKRGTRRNGKSVYEILVSGRKLSGVLKNIIVENGKTYYAINDVAFGAAYELSDYYEKFLREDTKHFKPQIGNDATFYVSTDKKIVFSETVTYSYGFVIKAITDETEENICDLYMYTFDMGHEQLRLREKVTFITPENPKGVKIFAGEAVEKLKENGRIANKVIAYQTNANGEITKIATEYDLTGKKPVKMDYPLVKNHVIGGEGFRTDENRAYYNVLGRKYYVPEITSKISVPLSKERYIKTDEFSKGIIGNWGDVYLTEQKITIYNSSEFYVAGFCLEECGNSGAIDWLLKPVMIKDVSYGVNSDDIEGKNVKYYLNGVEVTTFVPEDVKLVKNDYYGVHGTGADLEKGDIIQLATDIDGNANVINIIMKADNRGTYRTQGDYGVEKASPFTGTGVLFGVVENITTENGGAFTLNVSDSGADSNTVVSAFISTAHQYGQNSYTLSEGKMVSNIELSDIVPGDVVVAIQRYALVTDVFVLR